jgi:hypothetical protein
VGAVSLPYACLTVGRDSSLRFFMLLSAA